MNDINNIFDEIYCISYLEDQQRYEHTQKIFKEYNINTTYIYTCDKPIYKNIKESYDSLHDGYYDSLCNTFDPNIYNKLFDNVLNMYTIIKCAYKRNFKHILIFEDDINFTIDKLVFNNIIDNIPNDYDMIKFYNCDDEYYLPITTIDNIEYTKDFINKKYSSYYCCNMVAYSYKGMKQMIELFELYGLKVTDLYYENMINNPNLNIYRLTTHFINRPFHSNISDTF